MYGCAVSHGECASRSRTPMVADTDMRPPQLEQASTSSAPLRAAQVSSPHVRARFSVPTTSRGAMVSKTLTLERVNDAFRAMEEGEVSGAPSADAAVPPRLAIVLGADRCLRLAAETDGAVGGACPGAHAVSHHPTAQGEVRRSATHRRPRPPRRSSRSRGWRRPPATRSRGGCRRPCSGCAG